LPARRSRTTQWRRCLEDIYERGGSLELAVAREYGDDVEGHHLVFRVAILGLSESEIVVEHPTTMGRRLPLEKGTLLVAIIAIGQNRWSFRTHLAEILNTTVRGRDIETIRLPLPDTVDRCQRRDFYRMNTASLNLPGVDLWPILDMGSVVLAERANELAVEAERRGESPSLSPEHMDLRPELGPKFAATLLNVGGGGIGLAVPPEYSQLLPRHHHFWVSLDLRPEIRTPVCATARVAHTHLQNDQSMYAGMAFDFTHNAVHQKFVIDQICRFIAMQQKSQTPPTGDLRRTA